MLCTYKYVLCQNVKIFNNYLTALDFECRLIPLYSFINGYLHEYRLPNFCRYFLDLLSLKSILLPL